MPAQVAPKSWEGLAQRNSLSCQVRSLLYKVPHGLLGACPGELHILGGDCLREPHGLEGACE